MSDTYTIIYPYTNAGFPSQMANMIQTMNTCNALGRTGKAQAHLALRNPSGWDRSRIIAHYGLDHDSAFDIHSIPLRHSRSGTIGKLDNLLYRVLLVRAVCRLAAKSENVVIFARDPSIMALLAMAPPLRRTRFAYEAHNLVRLSLGHTRQWYGDSHATPSWKIGLYARLERRALYRADLVFALTRGLKKMLIAEYGIHEEKITVLPDAARKMDFDTPPDNGARNGPLVGYVGQLFPSRGVDILIRSLPLLDESVNLLLVGGNDNTRDMRRLAGLARSLGVEHRISFRGFVEPARIGHCLSRPDVLVMPLLGDKVTRACASSMKQFEYMAARKPIVATDLPSTREILRHGENAILVKPNSPEALAEGISLALKDKELARRISEAAHREVHEKYTFEKRAETIIAALEAPCPE